MDMQSEEKWAKLNHMSPEEANDLLRKQLIEDRLAEELHAGQEIERHIREMMKSPEQIRREEEYMFGKSKRKVRVQPKAPKTMKLRKANKVARKQRKKK